MGSRPPGALSQEPHGCRAELPSGPSRHTPPRDPCPMSVRASWGPGWWLPWVSSCSEGRGAPESVFGSGTRRALPAGSPSKQMRSRRTPVAVTWHQQACLPPCGRFPHMEGTAIRKHGDTGAPAWHTPRKDAGGGGPRFPAHHVLTRTHLSQVELWEQSCPPSSPPLSPGAWRHRKLRSHSPDPHFRVPL